MYYGENAVILNKTGSSKSVRLLQILLLSLKGGISKSELIDNLYGWNDKTDMANRNKNLNNLIYRLKGQLAAGGEYVEIIDGMCSFKSAIPLELDTQRFEDTVIAARSMGGKTHSFAQQSQRDVPGGAPSREFVRDMVFP